MTDFSISISIDGLNKIIDLNFVVHNMKKKLFHELIAQKHILYAYIS